MEEVEQILQDFTKALETTVFAVEINGIKREATLEIKLTLSKMLGKKQVNNYMS